MRCCCSAIYVCMGPAWPAFSRLSTTPKVPNCCCPTFLLHYARHELYRLFGKHCSPQCSIAKFTAVVADACIGTVPMHHVPMQQGIALRLQQGIALRFQQGASTVLALKWSVLKAVSKFFHCPHLLPAVLGLRCNERNVHNVVEGKHWGMSR